MKLKGLWFRILGLMVVLSLAITACGGSSGSSGAEASIPAASQEPVNPPIDRTNQPPAAAESSAEAAADASAGTDQFFTPGPALTSVTDDVSESADPDNTATATVEGEGSSGAGSTIRIGSKNFTEQFLLAEMYAQVLEANGFTVDRENIGLENETVAYQALQNGDIDFYPEYVATALQALLDQELPSPPDREQIYTTTQELLAQADPPIALLEPSGFEDNQALAMRRSRAEELGIRAYSDLSTKAGDLTLGAPPEFFERRDGLRGLQAAYGGFEFGNQSQLTPALRYPELDQGNVDVIVAFTTDGQLGSDDYIVLEDDQQFYPPYQVAPMVRQEVLDQNPQLADLLNSVTAALSEDQIMAGLNYQVDGPEAREVEDVAREFLQQQGLLQ